MTPRSIPPSESTHFRAITGDGTVESQANDVYVPNLRAGEATSAPAVDVEAISAAAHLITDLEEGRHSPGAHAISKTDSPSKRKGREHYLYICVYNFLHFLAYGIKYELLNNFLQSYKEGHFGYLKRI